MTRVSVGHALLQLALRLDQPNLCEVLRDIAHFGHKLHRPLGVFRIMLQQRRILLHRRAATGGVAHDGVELRVEHGVNVAAGLRARHLQKASMQVQRAATTLTAWDMDLDAVFREHANRGAIQLRKRYTADAADEERHAPAASAFGGIDFAKLAEREVALDARRESVKLGNTHELEQPSPACQALQA